METRLAPSIRDTPAGRDAEAVLRACVHCGFCNATCPTYQLLGDELDGPRGRIYLIKQVLEGHAATASTQLHLDRCLTCRACETTCPSGVEYHKLLDVGRAEVDRQVPRPAGQRVSRALLRATLPRRWLFSPLVLLGRAFRWALPPSLRRQLPRGWGLPRTARTHARKVLLLSGCVQPGLAPDINRATARVLDRAGIGVIEARGAGCCGALRFHLDAQEAGRRDARRLIDAWWPHIERGAEAIVATASGCGVQLRDFGDLLKHDAAYAQKAARVSELVRDVAEVVEAEAGRLFEHIERPAHGGATVAFQSPCTLQHGMRVQGPVELLLKAAGYELSAVADAHLCCGSAGTYSLLQPEISRQLRDRKLAALTAGNPDVIATANVGCLTHLAAGTATPVRHWIELLDERLRRTGWWK